MTSTETVASTPSNMMKSILVSEFAPNIKNGDCNAVTMGESAKPQLGGRNELIVRVLACSISPGDTMMLRGNAIFMHPSKFPYVPGMDICGIVDEVDPGVTAFKVRQCSNTRCRAIILSCFLPKTFAFVLTFFTHF